MPSENLLQKEIYLLLLECGDRVPPGSGGGGGSWAARYVGGGA